MKIEKPEFYYRAWDNGPGSATVFDVWDEKRNTILQKEVPDDLAPFLHDLVESHERMFREFYESDDS